MIRNILLFLLCGCLVINDFVKMPFLVIKRMVLNWRRCKTFRKEHQWDYMFIELHGIEEKRVSGE